LAVRSPASTTTYSACDARSLVKPMTASPTGDVPDPLPDLRDHPGQVTALAGRERRRPALRVLALPDPGLAGVDAGGADLDQCLSGPGGRAGDVGHLQDVDTAEPPVLHRLGHRVLLVRLDLLRV
jgi:hypothetical protein